MRGIWLLAAAMFASPVAAESYFCNGELSAGFKQVDGTWKSVTFNTEGDQFTVSRLDTPLGDFNFTVTQLGSADPLYWCESSGSRILCGGMVRGFILDTQTMRFQMVYGVGYFDDVGGDNTPAITAGRCSKL